RHYLGKSSYGRRIGTDGEQTKLNNLALLLKTTNNRFKWIAFPAIKGRKVLAAYAAKLFPQLKGITHDSKGDHARFNCSLAVKGVMIAIYDGGRNVMKTILWVLSMVYGLPSFPAWKTLTEDELKSRWLLLRSIEWINWPLFISQSVVPPLLWFYEWQPVVVAVIVVTMLWRLAIATRCVSVKLVEFGPLFVGLKFLISPIMALFRCWPG